MIRIAASFFCVGGNGFNDGLFLSGNISPVTGGDGVIFKNGFESE